jgi:uncharacterized membrane protein YkvA (DUF1232 family)
MLGIRMKKARVYFHSTIRYDRRDMSETPKEKANWMAMIILYLVLPSTNSLKKL